MMFNKILLAIDADGYAAGAVPIVAALARSSGASVFVLQVRDIEHDLRSREQAWETLDEAIDALAACGVPAIGEVRWIADGRPAGAIAQVAQEVGADLVAIGSHGRGDLSAILFGSVGHQVAAATSASVLIARPPAGATRFEGTHVAPVARILVGVGVDEPDAMARFVARLALETGARVRVVHARETVALAEGAAYIEPDSDAQAAVAGAQTALDSLGVVADAEIIDAGRSVARAVAEAADRWMADLVVLGSRRPSNLAGLVLGSVGHEVVHLTRRPVLLAERAARPVPA